jgi:hypothetical protein
VKISPLSQPSTQRRPAGHTDISVTTTPYSKRKQSWAVHTPSERQVYLNVIMRSVYQTDDRRRKNFGENVKLTECWFARPTFASLICPKNWVSPLSLSRSRTSVSALNWLHKYDLFRLSVLTNCMSRRRRNGSVEEALRPDSRAGKGKHKA